MASPRDLFPVFLSILVTVSTLLCQTGRQGTAPHQHTILAPNDLADGAPFSLDPIPGEHFLIRPADQMSPADKDLLASAQSAIRQAAHNLDIEYAEPGWTAEQIDCPVSPSYLLVRFTRTRNEGDISVFTAAIPRSTDGRVRIVPVLRRGYSPFTPAARSYLTITTFNHIRAEQKGTGKPNWIDVARCYVALAGSDPEIPRQAPEEAAGSLSADKPSLELGGSHQLIIRYDTLRPSPTQWKMTFDRQGKLLDVTIYRLRVPSCHSVALPSNQK